MPYEKLTCFIQSVHSFLQLQVSFQHPPQPVNPTRAELGKKSPSPHVGFSVAVFGCSAGLKLLVNGNQGWRLHYSVAAGSRRRMLTVVPRPVREVS